jgi:hypothetical protein
MHCAALKYEMRGLGARSSDQQEHCTLKIQVAPDKRLGLDDVDAAWLILIGLATIERIGPA